MEFMKMLKHLKFMLESIDPSKFAEVIYKLT
jgi:hypothetical protein